MVIKKFSDKISIYLDGSEIGKITWFEKGENLVVEHTFVDPKFRGNNYAKILVDEVVNYARVNGKKIIPVCPYVDKVLTREAKYNDVLNKCLLKETISRFENKESTIIDEQIDLSEDERLRIIWASALYRDGKIILIDDSDITNNETKYDLIKELLKLKNRIFIFITNDAEVIKNCDKIVIFKNNEIIEAGEIIELQKDKKSFFSTILKNKK